MNEIDFLNISKHNMDRFLLNFDFNKSGDVFININNNHYFLDILASLLYKQYNSSYKNKIIIAQNNLYNNNDIIINDEYCKKLAFQKHDKNSLNAFEFFDKYKDTFFYLKTSGSTGDALFIKKYINQMFGESKCLKDFFGADFSNKIVCSFVPHHHMYGLTFAVFMPIISNFKVIEKQPILENLQDLSENILITSPEFLKKMVVYDKSKLSPKIKQIELIITAGSMLDDNIRTSLKEITSADILNIYGSTETGLIAGDMGNGFNLFNSVKIVNDNGQYVLSSFWSDKYVLQDDIKLLDNDKIEVHGRNDRIVKIADKRFSLDMVEKYVKQSSLIYDAYSYIINNRIGTLISLSEQGKKVFRNFGKKGIVENIEKYVKDVFGKNIRHYKIVKNIYRNVNSKLIKKENDNLIDKRQDLEFIEEKVEKLESGVIQAIFSAYVREDLFYLPSHFYNFPLIAGFIELDSIVKLASNFGYDFTKINKITNLKFLSFIRPADNIKIELLMSDSLVKFFIYNNNTKAASGSIKYEL